MSSCQFGQPSPSSSPLHCVGLLPSPQCGKLPAFPPFLSDLFPAWPPSPGSLLLPSPIISDFGMFALAPAVSSLLRLTGDIQQKPALLPAGLDPRG